MKKVEIINVTKENIICSDGALANSFFSRLKGLIGKNELKINEGLCILPCKSVHTFFMKFSIDVIFVDKNGIVCKIAKNLKPYKISKYISKAQYVIELSSGMCNRFKIEIGDIIELR